MLIFTDPPPPKVYVLYTHENVDIFGRPLKSLHIYTQIYDLGVRLAYNDNGIVFNKRMHRENPKHDSNNSISKHRNVHKL